MKNILLTEFGSRVYGTSVPTSDTDIKGIFIPDAKDIILQRAPKQIINNTKKDDSAKNSATDVDRELFSLHQYLKLLCNGQTPAIDLLFTPERFHLEKASPLFTEIFNNRDKLISKNLYPVISYARTQAAKYGLKGSRVNAMKLTLDLLNSLPEYKTLGDCLLQVLPLVYVNREAFMGLENLSTGPINKHEFIDIVNIKNPKGLMEAHLMVCNKKYAFHCTVKYIKERIQVAFDNVGHRSMQASQNLNIDWKALYHAIRVSSEGIELCTTGNITFPRPEAPLLLKVRNGEMNYQEVAEIIENQLGVLETMQDKSVLRDTPDYKWVENFVENVYSKEVRNYYDFQEYGL